MVTSVTARPVGMWASDTAVSAVRSVQPCAVSRTVPETKAPVLSNTANTAGCGGGARRTLVVGAVELEHASATLGRGPGELFPTAPLLPPPSWSFWPPKNRTFDWIRWSSWAVR